jgi:DNA-binding transcriptional LysR family regulator
MHRTAEIIGISRPGVGQNIKELANQLGHPLFIGGRHGIEPTATAIAIYPQIKAAIDLITDAETNIEDFTENTMATIRLAVASTIASYNLVAYLKEFSQKYKNVKFEFYKKASMDLLQEKKIDLYIGPEYILGNHKFSLLNLFKDKFVLIASKSFLGKNNLGTTITREQLSALPYIGHNNFTQEFLIATGVKLNPFIYADTSEEIFSFVKNGMGIGGYFTCAHNIAKNNEVVELVLEGFVPPILNAVAAYNKDAITKATKVFLNGLTQHFANS